MMSHPTASLFAGLAMKRWMVVLTLALVFTGAAAPVDAQAPAKIQYARDILPILSTHCFTCHGPDAKLQKAGLRLDLFETATKKLKSGSRAVVPGKVKESELVARIFADDENERMPPKTAKKTLSETEKLLLKRW